jgi:hypothetical protein
MSVPFSLKQDFVVLFKRFTAFFDYIQGVMHTPHITGDKGKGTSEDYWDISNFCIF